MDQMSERYIARCSMTDWNNIGQALLGPLGKTIAAMARVLVGGGPEPGKVAHDAYFDDVGVLEAWEDACDPYAWAAAERRARETDPVRIAAVAFRAVWHEPGQYGANLVESRRAALFDAIDAAEGGE